MRNCGYSGSMMLLTQKFVLATFLLGLIWPTQGPQPFPFLGPLIAFFVNLIVLALILYVAGLTVVGGERAKISRAFSIAFLGAFVNFALNVFFILLPSPLSLSWEHAFIFRVILSFIIWLSLIKNFYRTSWLGALAVATLVLVMVVLELVLRDFLLSLKIFV